MLNKLIKTINAINATKTYAGTAQQTLPCVNNVLKDLSWLMESAGNVPKIVTNVLTLVVYNASKAIREIKLIYRVYLVVLGALIA